MNQTGLTHEESREVECNMDSSSRILDDGRGPDSRAGTRCASLARTACQSDARSGCAERDIHSVADHGHHQ